MKNHKYLFKIVSFSTMLLVVLLSGCKDDTKETNEDVVIPVQQVSQASVIQGSSENYVILAGAGISNNPTSIITGNIGLSPSASTFITGFSLIHSTGAQLATSAQITGNVFASDYGIPTPVNLTTAKVDLTIAFNDAAGRTSTDIVLLSGNLGGLTLTPGLYKSTGSLEISSGDLTFDAKGNSNAVFIIQIASTFSTSSDRKVILAGGAKAANIFWQVGTSATFGTNSVLKGTIMADQSISLNTGVAVEGRLLARIGSVTLEGNTITNPSL